MKKYTITAFEDGTSSIFELQPQTQDQHEQTVESQIRGGFHTIPCRLVTPTDERGVFVDNNGNKYTPDRGCMYQRIHDKFINDIWGA